ncbi:queuine tRNA-ribosyltransferase [Ceratobasidium sp. AG-Ba]|nr:queuine tRNA-ribosyltransferase [Ceratobasidium sp. AG-Ba]
MAARPVATSPAKIRFELTKSISSDKFSRLATFELVRDNGDTLALRTPSLMAPSSRGVVPHLSSDQLPRVPGLTWVHAPFESYLQDKTPLPALCPDNHPLHQLMGLSPTSHIVSISLRDPSSVNEMPANTNDFIQAQCIRGCRKRTGQVRPLDYISFVSESNPDIVVAPADTPFTPPPYSQKRIEKSISRSLTWLIQLANGLTPRPIFAPLMGEPTQTHAQHSPEDSQNHSISPIGKMGAKLSVTDPNLPSITASGRAIERLDETIAGYVLELAPIQSELRAQLGKQTGTAPPPLPTTAPSARVHAFDLNTPTLAAPDPLESDIVNYAEEMDKRLPELVRASFDHLPSHKPRLALGLALASPHVMLGLIEQGIDLIDSAVAIRCASAGLALDFVFPVMGEHNGPKLDVGHNLYDNQYEYQFVRLSDWFVDASGSTDHGEKKICQCAACSPIWEAHPTVHSKIDEIDPETDSTNPKYAPPFTRAYIHHLLHTHEMSAHTLLTFHNLAVIEAMMEGARSAIAEGTFEQELRRFEETYDGGMGVLTRAERDWRDVDRARGKGRLAREKAAKDRNVLDE